MIQRTPSTSFSAAERIRLLGVGLVGSGVFAFLWYGFGSAIPSLLLTASGTSTLDPAMAPITITIAVLSILVPIAGGYAARAAFASVGVRRSTIAVVLALAFAIAIMIVASIVLLPLIAMLRLAPEDGWVISALLTAASSLLTTPAWLAAGAVAKR